METSKVTQFLGSAAAGALGFALGFFTGLYLLGIWGQGADSIWYRAATAGLGSIFAGTAIALTVRSMRRWAAMATATALGSMLVLLALAIEAGLLAIIIGGLALVAVTVSVSRSGTGAMLN